MTSSIITPGTLTYNGFTFSSMTQILAKIDMVYDEAGRTVAENRWTLQVRSTIVRGAADASTSETLGKIRKQLSKPGQSFELTDWGFGPDIRLNYSAAGAKDTNWGPKPVSLDITPIGHTNSAVIEWVIQFSVPYCEDDGNYTGIQSIVWGINWSVDKYGWTTRTVAGYLAIAMSMDLDGAPPDSADQYRETLNVDTLPGYTREQDYDLTPDRSRLNFRVTDTQIKSLRAYPEDVVDIRGKHRARMNPRVRTRTDHNLNVSMTVVPTIDRARVLEIFKAIVRDLIQPAKDQGHTVMLDELSVSDPIWGDEYDMDLTWRVITVSDDNDLWFQEQGMFRELDADNDAQWLAHQSSIDTGHRGISELFADPGNDHLRDLCNAETGESSTYISAAYPANEPYTELCNELPLPQESWIHWESSVGEKTQNNTVFSIELGDTTVENNGYSTSDTEATLNGIDGYADLETVLSQAPPGMQFVYKGYAERLGYPIPKPDLTELSTVPLEKVGTDKFMMRNAGQYFCVDKYVAGWEITYQVLARPEQMPDSDYNPNTGL